MPAHRRIILYGGPLDAMAMKFLDAWRRGESLAAYLHEDALFRDASGVMHAGRDSAAQALAENVPETFKQQYPFESFHVFETPTLIGKVKTLERFIHRVYVQRKHSGRRLKLDMSYDGSHFSGFQKQPRVRTVQGVLERILAHILGHRADTYAAGRTDRGVHALSQTVHVDTTQALSTSALKNAIGGTLPDDIVLHSVEEVPQVFHARYDAVARTYLYTIVHEKNPFYSHYALYHPVFAPEDLEHVLKRAEGSHDFRSFSKKVEKVSPVKYIHDVKVEREGVITRIEIKGNAFLRHMVRILVGNALYDLDKGTSLVKEGIEKPSLNAIKHMAKAEGLTLKEVHYK